MTRSQIAEISRLGPRLSDPTRILGPYLYHITPWRHLESIRERGLAPPRRTGVIPAGVLRGLAGGMDRETFWAMRFPQPGYLPPRNRARDERIARALAYMGHGVQRQRKLGPTSKMGDMVPTGDFPWRSRVEGVREQSRALRELLMAELERAKAKGYSHGPSQGRLGGYAILRVPSRSVFHLVDRKAIRNLVRGQPTPFGGEIVTTRGRIGPKRLQMLRILADPKSGVKLRWGPLAILLGLGLAASMLAGQGNQKSAQAA